jgi:hypothetical protein
MRRCRNRIPRRPSRLTTDAGPGSPSTCASEIDDSRALRVWSRAPWPDAKLSTTQPRSPGRIAHDKPLEVAGALWNVLAVYTAAPSGSGRTITVSATGMISSTGSSAREACSRIASGLLA